MAWDVDSWREERDRQRAAEAEQQRKAFRLRETIIVTIALILLIVVLVPVFRKRSEQDLSRMSAQNLMQWGIALNLYMIENDNTLPEVGPNQVDPELEAAWYNGLPPYLSQTPLGKLSRLEVDGQNPSLWVDPSVPPDQVPRYVDYPFTYAMNRYLQPSLEFPAARIFDLQNPGAVVFLTEVLGTDPGALPADVRFRHGDKEPRAHVLFTDGHVELVHSDDLVGNPAALAPETELAAVSWAPFVGAPVPETE